MEKLTTGIIRGLYNIKNESPEYTDLIRLIVKALKRVCELDVAVKNVQNCVTTILQQRSEGNETNLRTTYHEILNDKKQRADGTKPVIDANGISQSENESQKTFRSDCYWYCN